MDVKTTIVKTISISLAIYSGVGATQTETSSKYSQCVDNCKQINKCEKRLEYYEEVQSRVDHEKRKCSVDCMRKFPRPDPYPISRGKLNWCTRVAQNDPLPFAYFECTGEKRKGCILICEKILERIKANAYKEVGRCSLGCQKGCKKNINYVPSPTTGPDSRSHRPLETWGGAPSFPFGLFESGDYRPSVCVTDQFGTRCGPPGSLLP